MAFIAAKAPSWRMPGGRTAREGGWVAIGQLMSAIATLASIRIMTGWLDPAEFGRLTLLIGIAALALGLTATPRLQALMRYYADWARIDAVDTVRRVGARSLRTPVMAGCLLLIGGWMLLAPLLHGARLTGMLVAALLVVDSVRMFELSLLNAARRQRAAALVYVADAWARPFCAVVAVAMLGASAIAALFGYVAGAALVVAAMRRLLRLEGRGASRPDRPVAPLPAERDLAAAIPRYAWPLAPLAIAGWISGVGDRYVIGGLLDLGQAGLYAAAYGLASRPFLMMSGVIELTMRPILHEAVAAGEPPLVARVKRLFIASTIGGAVLGVGSFALLSGFGADILLASAYRGAGALMPWIALGYGFYTVAIVFSRFCYAFDDTRAILIQTVVGAGAGIAIMIPAIRYGGLLGAAMVVPVRFLLELLLALRLSGLAERRFFANAPRRDARAAC